MRPERPNAVARVGTGAGPALVLCAHLDTVGTEGMTDTPFEPTIEGDRIHGRGSYDMKASVAAVMAAMAALACQPIAGTAGARRTSAAETLLNLPLSRVAAHSGEGRFEA